MRDLLARYAALRRWVERERRRIARTGAQKTERYLRRARLVDSIDARSLRELLRELGTIDRRGRPGGSSR